MAWNQLPPPVPFPAIPGDPPVPWHRCFQSFQTYLIAYGLDDKSVSDARPREIPSHCLSTEGQRVFSLFDASSDSREGSTATQNRNSGSKHSIIMSRYNFRQRSQQAGQSVIQFVAALRELSTLCNFGGLCEEMRRDKLIEKTSMNRIRERQPLELDFLAVYRAILLALQVEMAMMLARTLQPSQVQHVSLKPLRAHRDWKHPPPLAAQPSSARSGRSSGKWWTNCGSISVSRYHTHWAEMQRGSLAAEDEHSRGAVGPRVWSLRMKRKVSQACATSLAAHSMARPSMADIAGAFVAAPLSHNWSIWLLSWSSF